MKKEDLHQVEQVHVHRQCHQQLTDHVDYDGPVEMLSPSFYQ
jgi:hypothetical protein